MTRSLIFGVDQVAGGEYLLPLLERWRDRGGPKHVIYASAVCARLLGQRGFDVRELNPANTETAGRAISEGDFDAVVLNASVGSELERSFLEAAHDLGIPILQFVDAWVTVQQRFASAWLPDRVAVADEAMKRELAGALVPGERISVVGLPSLEAKFLRARPNSYRGPPRALLVTQPVRKHYGASLGYDEYSFIETCLSAWHALDRSDSDLTLLVHPAEATSTYRPRLPEAVAIVQNTPLSAIPHSVVLGMFSSVLVESLLLGSPAISVQPMAAGPNLCSLVDAGHVPLARTAGELGALLGKVECRPGPLATKSSGFREVILGSLSRFEDFVLQPLPERPNPPRNSPKISNPAHAHVPRTAEE